MNGKCDLSEFRAHSKDCGDPHPEHGTRTADRDRTGDTGDISGTDRSGEGRTDSLERSHGAVRSFLLFENSSERGFQCIREFANLDKSGSDTQKQADTDNADHRRDTPDEVINGIVDGFDCLKHDSNPFLDNV